MVEDFILGYKDSILKPLEEEKNGFIFLNTNIQVIYTGLLQEKYT